MGYRGKTAEQERARVLRAQAWTLQDIEAMDAWGAAQLGELDRQAFLAAGAALYAGDGSKRDGGVHLANSNPDIIAFFCTWLRACFDIDESRLRLRLYLHQGLDLDEANRFWSQLTRIPVSQFQRPYRAVPDESIRTAKHVHGCAHVMYSCSRTHRAVMGLIRALLSSPGLDPG